MLAVASIITAQTNTVDLSGYWDFQVDTGEHVTKGEFTLGKSGDAYLGTLTTQGRNTLAIRSLKLDGTQIDMIVDTPEGVVRFQGTLGEDGKSMKGTVTYHKGMQFPMTATKQS